MGPASAAGVDLPSPGRDDEAEIIDDRAEIWYAPDGMERDDRLGDLPVDRTVGEVLVDRGEVEDRAGVAHVFSLLGVGVLTLRVTTSPPRDRETIVTGRNGLVSGSGFGTKRSHAGKRFDFGAGWLDRSGRPARARNV